MQDSDFPRLSGARIVRIATHPELSRAGYGSMALKLLKQYFEGELGGVRWWRFLVFLLGETDGPDRCFACPDLKDSDAEEGGVDGNPGSVSKEKQEPGSLLEEKIVPRTGLPPLLVNLSDRCSSGADNRREP